MKQKIMCSYSYLLRTVFPGCSGSPGVNSQEFIGLHLRGKKYSRPATWGRGGRHRRRCVTHSFTGEGAGLKQLLKTGFMVRLGKWWWVVLLTFPVLIGGALALSFLLGYPVPEFPHWNNQSDCLLPWLLFFNAGPLQEEFGWRGYAFEHLRNKYSALTAAILAGLMWGLWHLPLFFAARRGLL